MQKNWKTTTVGVLAGLAMLWGGAVQNRQQDPTAPPITLGNFLPAAALAALGILAKDYNVTGGPDQK